MPRAIVAGAVYRPSYRQGTLSAEAPDEDEFTMAVAAVERLLARTADTPPPIEGLHLVGEFPKEADLGVPEALGVPHVAIERHGAGIAGLGAALRAASRSESAGSSLVLVADRAKLSDGERPAAGAAAVALELRPGAGFVPTGHGGRRHPTYRSPDANGWVADAVRHSGLPGSGATGTLYFVAKESPPVLLAFWRRGQPSMAIVPGAISLPGVGVAASVSPALWLLDLAGRPDGGEWGVLARVTSEETQFLGFHRTGLVERLDDDGSTEGNSGMGPQPRSIPEEALRAVSEGAYVPWPRYVENLPSRWRLLAERCSACGTLTFPIRGRCRSCGMSDGLSPEPLPRNGTVLAATVVAPGAHPTEFDPMVEVNGAYGVVLAELAPGVRATLQVADHGEEPLVPGSRVTTELRRLYPMEGAWRYGRKAVVERPARATR